jgi:predicted nucleic acid-binding protein
VEIAHEWFHVLIYAWTFDLGSHASEYTRFGSDIKHKCRSSIKVYEEKNVKFADAVMAFWGIEKRIATAYTYDEVDFKRIEGLTVLKP